LEEVDNELVAVGDTALPLPWVPDIVILSVLLLGTVDGNAIGKMFGKFDGVLSAPHPTPLAPIRAVNVLPLLSVT
jgi:hypothetical protein